MSAVLLILGIIAGAFLPFALIWLALWLAGTIGEIFDL
jgi:hypothetical protein